MDIKAQIQRDRIEAMKTGQSEKKATLDYILGEIQKKEKDPSAKGDIAASVIAAYIKSLREFIDQHKADKPEICAKYEAEIAMLASLLPLQFSVEEQECLRARLASLKDGWREKQADQVQTIRVRLGQIADRMNRLTDALIDASISKEIFEPRKTSLLHEKREGGQTQLHRNGNLEHH
jgi:uncharacterized protein YqeY